MEKRIGSGVIEVVKGDITKETVDAIVNAANESLLGGGGVDGAIHRAGGPAILEECRKLGGCRTGDAKITTAGRMPSKYVIHTVGPVYRDGAHGEPEKLASCHRRSLEVALENGVKTVAFPAISCGVDAARIALSEVANFLQRDDRIRQVVFVLFDEHALEVYRQTAAKLKIEYSTV